MRIRLSAFVALAAASLLVQGAGVPGITKPLDGGAPKRVEQLQLGAGPEAVLAYFVCCGVSRLARFNVTAEQLAEGNEGGKVKYFEGTPIPTSVALTGVLAFACWQGRIGESLYGGALALGPWTLHPLVLLFALSGSLMISKTVRIPKW